MRLHIHISDEEGESISLAVGLLGVKLSPWLRSLARREAERVLSRYGKPVPHLGYKLAPPQVREPIMSEADAKEIATLVAAPIGEEALPEDLRGRQESDPEVIKYRQLIKDWT